MRALVAVVVLGLIGIVVLRRGYLTPADGGPSDPPPAAATEPPQTSPEPSSVVAGSALRELLSVLDGDAQGNDFLDQLAASVKRGPSAEDGTGAWRQALGRALRDRRSRGEFPLLVKRFRESHEVKGDYALGLGRMEELQAALENPSWLELRQIRYGTVRLMRAAGDHRAANAKCLELAEEEPPPGLSEADLGIHRWMSGNITRELATGCFETGQLQFAARLAAQSQDLVLKARVNVARGRYELALQNLDHFDAQGGRGWNITRRSTRAVASWRLGRTEEAKTAFVAILEDPNASEAWGTATRLSLGRLALEEGELSLTERMIEELRESKAHGPLTEVRISNLAFKRRLAEGSKGDLLDELREEVRGHFADWLNVWHSGPLVPSGLEFLSAYQRQEVLHDVIEAELSAPGGEARGLQRVLEAQACGTTARRLNAPSRTVAELQEYLRQEGGGAIAFAPGPERTFVFRVDAQGVNVERSSSRADLTGTHRAIEAAFLRSDQEKGDSDLVTLASQVTGSMLPEETQRALAEWSKVRFSGIDVMTPLPAAMLRTQGNEWLGCAKEVAEWPSIVVALALAEAPRGDLSQGVAIIEPEPTAGEQPPLPFTAQERGRLSAALGGSEAVISGEEASAAALALSNGGVAYVHCHGGMDYASARPGRLLLSGARRASSADIELALSGPRPPRHVILGACGAGRGKRTLGEDGADHLGAAFLVKGARSVLIPSIDIFHEPTKEFALRHLEGLASGQRVGESILETRRAMMAAGAAPLDALALRWIGVADQGR